MNALSLRFVPNWVLMALTPLVLCSSAALAQTPQLDSERMRRDGVERNDAAARAHGMEMERQRQQRERQEEERRRQEAVRESYQSSPSSGGSYAPSPSGGTSGGTGGADMRALGREMLRQPPLPAERNVLLGSWRLEGGGQQSKVLEFGLTGKGATPGLGEMMGYTKSIESGQLACDMSFGRGITFTPTTFSSGGAAGMVSGPIAYRSRNKQVIVAIPGDSRANPMFFEIVGPDRIVWGGNCALVRAGSPAGNAAANATTVPSNARTAAERPSMPPAMAASDAVADGAAFRCADGSLLHVSLCQGASADAPCKLTELHKPGLQIGTMTRRADIAARVKSCEPGGIRYGADDKPVFVR